MSLSQCEKRLLHPSHLVNRKKQAIELRWGDKSRKADYFPLGEIAVILLL